MFSQQGAGVTRRRPPPLTLTAPGGPPGWPLGSALSFADALAVLGGAQGGKVYVLGIDQARRSGWCLHDGYRPVMSGVCGSTLETVDALEQCRDAPGFDWGRVLVAFEDHREINKRQRWSADGKPERNPIDTAIGLGDARGGWRVLLDLRAQPKSQRILVHPSDWHVVIKGMRFGVGDDWKSAAMRYAAMHVARALADDNEADAIVIATWAAATGLHAWATDRLMERAKDRAARAADRRPA